MANKTQQVIFARHSNNLRKDNSFSSQRALNMYAEAGNQDDYSQVMMRHGSGLKPVAHLGGTVRALRCIAEGLYAVAGGRLWQIDRLGQAVALGELPDDSDSYLAGNRQQIAVTAGGKMFVYQDGVLAEATDNEAPAGIETMDYLDGFGIVTLETSDQFFATRLEDFNTINALEFASAESAPDRAVRVLVDHREVWVFGSKTIEVWYNAGTSPFPLARASEATMERGLVGRHTPAKLDNTVFWVGDDLQVHRAEGYVPKRISNHALERIIADLTPDQREQMRGFTWAEEGHKFYALWMPNGTTWVFDVSTSMWHERGTFGTSKSGPWRAWMAEYAHGRNFAGGHDGWLYEIDRDWFYDGETPIQKVLVSPPIHFGDARFVAQYFSADIRAGWPSDMEIEPQLHLSLSRDRGHTWRRRGGKGMGKSGDFNRKVRWWGMGMQRELHAMLECRDPVALSVYGAHVRYKTGAS